MFFGDFLAQRVQTLGPLAARTESHFFQHRAQVCLQVLALLHRLVLQQCLDRIG